MREFITHAAQRLRVPEETAQAATVALLEFIREQVDSRDYAELLTAVPGAGELAPSRHARAAGLPAVFQRAALEISGRRRAARGLQARLELAGLTLAESGAFTTLFLEQVRRQAGADLLAFIAGPIPELRSFL